MSDIDYGTPMGESGMDTGRTRCPDCFSESLFETDCYWMIPEDSEPKEKDKIMRCSGCWMQWTKGHLLSHQPTNEDMLKEVVRRKW